MVKRKGAKPLDLTWSVLHHTDKGKARQVKETKQRREKAK